MTITKEQFAEFISAVRLIAHGPTSGPSGLEGVGIALAGDHFGEPVGPALASLALAVEHHAEAITEAAQTIAAAIDNLDNAECLRAFRDACHAFVASKESSSRSAGTPLPSA
jgi:hypothetical protein